MTTPAAPIVVPTRFIPKGYDAVTFYPRIYVHKGAAVDAGLLVHETVHWGRQRDMGRWRWLFKDLTDEDFRYAEELLAYTAQVRAGGLTLERAATYLTTYHTGRSQQDAVKDLTDELAANPPPPAATT